MWLCERNPGKWAAIKAEIHKISFVLRSQLKHHQDKGKCLAGRFIIPTNPALNTSSWSAIKPGQGDRRGDWSPDELNEFWPLHWVPKPPVLSSPRRCQCPQHCQEPSRVCGVRTPCWGASAEIGAPQMFSDFQACAEDQLHPAIAAGYVCLQHSYL